MSLCLLTRLLRKLCTDFREILWVVGVWPKMTRLDFETDLDQNLDSGSFYPCFQHEEIGHF